MPGAGPLRISGVVDMVRARHEGSRFDSDVFLADQGLLPVETARAAHVVVTRFEPELYVPPRPGDAVVRATGAQRDEALYFDVMEQRLPPASAATTSRSISTSPSSTAAAAPTSTSPASPGSRRRRPTPRSCCTRCSHSEALGAERANTKALIFNVKGEDLLFLDKPNARLTDEHRAEYARARASRGAVRVGRDLGAGQARHRCRRCPTPAAARRASSPTSGRSTSSCASGCCASCSPRPSDERSQVADLIARVEVHLDREAEDVRDHPGDAGCPDSTGTPQVVRSFDELCELIAERLEDEHVELARVRSPPGTVSAFLRRLDAARFHCGHLIKGAEAADIEAHRIDSRETQVR